MRNNYDVIMKNNYDYACDKNNFTEKRASLFSKYYLFINGFQAEQYSKLDKIYKKWDVTNFRYKTCYFISSNRKFDIM